MSIRPAQLSDLDAIAWISLAAAPADPVHPYRYPLLHEYPEDFAHYGRLRVSDYLADAAAGKSTIMLFELPSIEYPSVNKPVAYSVWEHAERQPKEIQSDNQGLLLPPTPKPP